MNSPDSDYPTELGIFQLFLTFLSAYLVTIVIIALFLGAKRIFFRKRAPNRRDIKNIISDSGSFVNSLIFHIALIALFAFFLEVFLAILWNVRLHLPAWMRFPSTTGPDVGKS
jgi:hypothetical protein